MPAVASGTCTYNGVSFTYGSRRMEVSVDAVRDEANRTTIFTRLTIRIAATITAGGVSTDTTIDLLRRQLMEPTGALYISDVGFGPLSVNQPGSAIRDVENGPVPTMLSWKPSGDNLAADIVWQVVVAVPSCATGGRYTGIASVNYSIGFDIGRQGETTRNINGHLLIAMSPDVNLVPDSADTYREQLIFAVPNRFRRERQSWNTSLDKRRVDFSITDVEVHSPNAPPPGIISIDADASIRWSRREGKIYRGSISATIVRHRDTPGTESYLAFGSILAQRLEEYRNQVTADQFILIDHLSASESIFGYTDRFEAGFRYASSLKRFLSDAGMWQPIGTSWTDWKTSLEVPWGHRGNAGIGHLPFMDVVTNLCGSSLPAIPDVNDDEQEPEEPEEVPPVKNETPPEATSWFGYSMRLQPYRHRPVVRQSTLQAPDEDVVSPSAGTQFAFPDPTGTNDVIQTGGRSRYSVVLSGVAHRAGHKISRPGITSIGGQTPTEVASVFEMIPVDNWLGVPIYRAQWWIEYIMPNSPGVVHPLDNLKEGIAGQSGEADQPV